VLQEHYSLSELSDATGIEVRTIRSYIERGLLPGAQTRGRAATYSEEHRSRLEVIKSLRRARPNITLSEIRIFLQGLNTEQIHSLARGSITAAVRAINEPLQEDDISLLNDGDADDDVEMPRTDWGDAAAKLTGAERLVRLLRQVSGFIPPASASKVETWQRIVVTPDIELSVRAEFDSNQLVAFRELADLLGYLLTHTDALAGKGEE
jgi:DNA-binding transcriptional MerR regulator